MGKRNKKKALKPFCYYCERTFDDDAVLVKHQIARHFKCEICHKKMSSLGSLMFHMYQLHQKSLERVSNAKDDRSSTGIEVYGMEGIPAIILEQRAQKEGIKDVKKRKEEPKPILLSQSGPVPIIPPPANTDSAAAIPIPYIAPITFPVSTPIIPPTVSIPIPYIAPVAAPVVPHVIPQYVAPASVGFSAHIAATPVPTAAPPPSIVQPEPTQLLYIYDDDSISMEESRSRLKKYVK